MNYFEGIAEIDENPIPNIRKLKRGYVFGPAQGAV